jgi:hypothetical protein
MHEPYSLQLCKLCVILQSLAHHVMTCQRKNYAWVIGYIR